MPAQASGLYIPLLANASSIVANGHYRVLPHPSLSAEDAARMQLFLTPNALAGSSYAQLEALAAAGNRAADLAHLLHASSVRGCGSDPASSGIT